MTKMWTKLAQLMALLLVAACAGTEGSEGTVSIDFEQYQLENGLDVILHVDRSDPVAAVAMTFHVGSAREVEGRTGFAHLFEHLFFLDSENLGPGGLDRLMTRVGSSTNGSTSRDRTNYFEVVPVDGLEKTLWAEADKLGFFINTVSESVVDKERQVVKNEKRQSVDNQPYGHNSYVIDRAMYPAGHPYHHQVIGSLADLDAASLDDVVDFHEKWYGPNNATLVVAGDIDVEQTKAWIDRYFAEIPTRPTPETVTPAPVELASTVRLFHEDNYARLPMLTMAWPAVPMYDTDSYALNMLGDILTDGKTSPFYEVIVEETEVAPGVSAGLGASELAGRFTLTVRAFPDKDLDEVYEAIEQAFARFEEEGAPAEELTRIKARYETGFYGGLSSVLGKAFQMAQYSIFADDPGYATEDLRLSLAVTEADVVRVYEQYIKDRPFIATSFVPAGMPEMALSDSERAEVVEEPIVMGAEEELGLVLRGRELTPSAIDRTVEPPYGEPASLTAPTVWRAHVENGIEVLGIEDYEVPLVQFELRIRGGQLLEDAEKVGVANLLAQSMMAGTANRTPAELEQAIDMLGSSISVGAGAQSFSISGSTLRRNFEATMELVEEILLEPRYDEDEFALSQQRVQNALRQRSASPTGVAADVFQTLLYGDHILGQNRLGDAETVGAITTDDLRGYHTESLSPGLASFHISGAIDEEAVLAALEGIATRWTGAGRNLPSGPEWEPSRAGLYFVDVPNASQSVLRIGYLALSQTDDAYYPANVMNFRLGGGGFASDLTQVLREQRGYTYGIGSGFSGSQYPGPFQISSSVRSNITYEALDVIKEIVESHGPDFDETDLESTQSYLLRANAGAFETGFAKLGLLASMSTYGFPADYLLQREEIVRDMTIEEIQRLADEYLDPDRMIWLVVGDASTQLDRLRALGLGEPTLLDREGQPIG